MSDAAKLETLGSLNSRAMLVTLNMSCWMGRKHDKKVTQEVAATHGASEDAGRYNKLLLGQKAPVYQAVWTAVYKARNTHKFLTLPWSEDGSRILPAAPYWDYTNKMRELRDEFFARVDEFVAEYPALQAEAKALLNGLFDAADYPEVSGIRGKFRFETRILPMPDPDDFRVQLSDAETEQVRQTIERTCEEATQSAMKDLWNRLYSPVSALAERLQNPDGILQHKTFENLKELCSLLPRLNLSGDAELDRMAEQVAAMVEGGVSSVKSSDTARETMAAKAAAIASQMEGFMQAALD